MANATLIGRASFVRGRVTGEGDLEIAGRVEGDVVVSGEVVIDTSGLVVANVTGARIVVRGAVKGDLVANETLHVEAGARVVGDLRAPRIAIAPGGLVRGHVQTGVSGSSARPRAVAIARATVPETKIRPVTAASVPARVVASPSSRVAPPSPPPKSVMKAVSVTESPKPTAAVRPGPPPPVVPVLKKGTKAVQKKRG